MNAKRATAAAIVLLLATGGAAFGDDVTVLRGTPPRADQPPQNPQPVQAAPAPRTACPPGYFYFAPTGYCVVSQDPTKAGEIR